MADKQTARLVVLRLRKLDRLKRLIGRALPFPVANVPSNAVPRTISAVSSGEYECSPSRICCTVASRHAPSS
jgi:hypothetical protein